MSSQNDALTEKWGRRGWRLTKDGGDRLRRREVRFAARPDPGEVDEVFEVPFDFLMLPANARHLDVEYRGGRRKLVEFQWAQHRIWGATAAMLVNLRKRLEATA